MATATAAPRNNRLRGPWLCYNAAMKLPPPLPTTAFAFAAVGPPASPFRRRPAWALLLAALALAGILAGLLALLLPAARPADAHQISINSIRVASDAGADGEYTAGEVITIEVTFSQTVKSWSNSPYIGIQVGNNARNALAEAVPDGGNTDATIAFHYTVGAVDQDTDGITVPQHTRLLGGITHTMC